MSGITTYPWTIIGGGHKQSVTISEVHISYVAICMEKSAGQEINVIISDMSQYLVSLHEILSEVYCTVGQTRMRQPSSYTRKVP